MLGFLRYNFNGASVFLGDSGSLLIGFMLGCYGALWSEKSVTFVALTVPLLAVSIPLIDVVLSILRRFLRNQPIFQADRGHIHHRLLDLGLSPKKAVLTMYGICAVVAVLSLLASALHNQFSGLIVILSAARFGSASANWTTPSLPRPAACSWVVNSAGSSMSKPAWPILKRSLSKAASVEECWAPRSATAAGVWFSRSAHEFERPRF